MPKIDAKQDFVKAYRSFEIPLANFRDTSVAHTLAPADLDSDGIIAGEVELEKAYEVLCQLPGGPGNGLDSEETKSQRGTAFSAVCGAMQQTSGEDSPLGNGSLLTASPTLASIIAGIPGAILRPVTGRKTLGTRPIQEALNYISQHHAANDGAASRYGIGTVDSYYGPQTE